MKDDEVVDVKSDEHCRSSVDASLLAPVMLSVASLRLGDRSSAGGDEDSQPMSALPIGFWMHPFTPISSISFSLKSSLDTAAPCMRVESAH